MCADILPPGEASCLAGRGAELGITACSTCRRATPVRRKWPEMKTNKTTGNTTHALVRQAAGGEARSDSMPTIQEAVVDTVEFSFDVEIGQAM